MASCAPFLRRGMLFVAEFGAMLEPLAIVYVIVLVLNLATGEIRLSFNCGRHICLWFSVLRFLLVNAIDDDDFVNEVLANIDHIIFCCTR